MDSGPESNEEDEEEEKVQMRNRTLNDHTERHISRIPEVESAESVELDFLKHDIKRVLKS